MAITMSHSEYMTFNEWLLSVKTVKLALEIGKELGLEYQPPNWSLIYDFYNGHGFEADSFATNIITNLFRYELQDELEYGDKLTSEQSLLLNELNLDKHISDTGTLTRRIFIFDSSHNFKAFNCEIEDSETHAHRPFEAADIYFSNNYMVLAMYDFAFNPLGALEAIAIKFKEEGYGVEYQNTVSS
ncbi:hypothetical protein ACH0B6_17085 [Solibacillus silvestris]